MFTVATELDTTGEHTEHREFIRHPSHIPIEYCLVDKPICASDCINNISLGGLSFQTEYFIEPDSWIQLRIPIDGEHFELDARVRWCRPRAEDHHYDVGALFTDKAKAFSARMVEQVCHIHEYKNRVLEQEGRQLSEDEAATEWIEKFANEFPPHS